VAAARSACALCLAARPEIRTPRIVLAHGLLAHRGVPEIPDVVRPLWVADAADTEAGALLAYGLARADKREATEAVAVARDVLARDPTYVMAHIALSQAFRKLEQHQDGLEHLDRALQVLKENWALLAERGLTLWCLGRYDEAEADIALAVKKSPAEKVNVEAAFASLKKKRPRP
jgi:tetratricopeptide (TPR) repeat protein